MLIERRVDMAIEILFLGEAREVVIDVDMIAHPLKISTEPTARAKGAQTASDALTMSLAAFAQSLFRPFSGLILYDPLSDAL